MTSAPISASVNLDKVDFDRVDVHERDVAGSEHKLVLSRISFGWYDDLVICGTDPDRFEALAEACMDAARGLRIVQGVAERVDELDPFAKGDAA